MSYLFIAAAAVVAVLWGCIAVLRASLKRERAKRELAERSVATLEGERDRLVKAIKIEREYHRKRGEAKTKKERVVKEIEGAKDDKDIRDIVNRTLADFNSLPNDSNS